LKTHMMGHERFGHKDGFGKDGHEHWGDKQEQGDNE
jgi:hypothetical protein